jgi:hypothetical protein
LVRDETSRREIDGPSQAHAARKLKAVYKTTVEEELPKRFRELLEALERRELEPRPRLIVTVSRLFGHAVGGTVGTPSPETGWKRPTFMRNGERHNACALVQLSRLNNNPKEFTDLKPLGLQQPVADSAFAVLKKPFTSAVLVDTHYRARQLIDKGAALIRSKRRGFGTPLLVRRVRTR